MPTASCGLPASIGRAALKRSRRKRTPAVPLPSWPCSGWGLPSRPGYPGRWWSLTPPFHPYLPGPARGRTGAAVCFLWHCPAGHPGSVLPTTLPCGARTFLTAHRAARPPGRLARHRKDMLPRPAGHDRRRFSAASADLSSDVGLDRGRLSHVGSPVTLEVPRPGRRYLRGAFSVNSHEYAPGKPGCR